MQNRPTVTRVRESIATQLSRYFTENGIEWTRDPANPLCYVVDGASYTPGEAADRFLPGGFAANFGKTVDRPLN